MSSDAALRVAPRDRLLGELLLDAGLVGAADLERGLALQQKIGGRIGSVGFSTVRITGPSDAGGGAGASS